MNGLPVDQQPAFRHVKQIVDECAGKLGIASPHLFVRCDSRVDAYVTGICEPHILVLSSQLYELFKHRPDEMRFVIGHELGHIKCGHIRSHAVGRALMQFVRRGNSSRFRPGFVAKLIVGQLMMWFRESQFSADRAALLCVDGDLDAAECALLRFKHGTQEDVDRKVAYQEQIDFLNEPFVRIMRKVQARGDAPYIFDRIVQLRGWRSKGGYDALAKRTAMPEQKKLVIDSIKIRGLPNADISWGDGRKCDPIVRAVVGRKVFSTDFITDNNAPSLSMTTWEAPCSLRTPIFVEVLDHDSVSGHDFIGGAMFQLRSTEKSGGWRANLKLRRDIKKRTAETDLPQVTLEYHFES